MLIMNRKISILIFIILILGNLSSCSNASVSYEPVKEAILPEFIRDTWVPENGQGIALRFEQNEKKAEVFYIGLDKFREGTVDWVGPLPIHNGGNNMWGFTLGPVERKTPDKIMITNPPSYKVNIKYIQDQHNRVLERSYDLMEGERKVMASLQEAKLIIDGLWVHVEVDKWMPDGAVDKVSNTTLKTTYIKRTSQR